MSRPQLWMKVLGSFPDQSEVDNRAKTEICEIPEYVYLHSHDYDRSSSDDFGKEDELSPRISRKYCCVKSPRNPPVSVKSEILLSKFIPAKSTTTTELYQSIPSPAT